MSLMIRKIKSVNWLQILVLQLMVFAYSYISTLAKKVSGLKTEYGLFSLPFLLGLGGIFAALAAYAFFWQKVLKRVDLSIAYSNKAVGLLWTLLWAPKMFGEQITVKNVAGILIICIGVLIVTSGGEQDAAQDCGAGETTGTISERNEVKKHE